MQLSRNFFDLAFFLLALTSAGKATPLVSSNQAEVVPVGGTELEPASLIKSHEEMLHWLQTTHANLTFVGEPLNPLAKREAQSTIVVYCNAVDGDDCEGDCTVYVGGAKCISASGTQCLAATKDIQFCTGILSLCILGCEQLSECGDRLATGFCSTPGTRSISVP